VRQARCAESGSAPRANVPPAVALPQSLRRLTPDRVRDQPRLRALALAAGLIPPRTMHSTAEAALLSRLAGAADRVVELGVYEGASAVVLCRAMRAGAELHLVDPFIDPAATALRVGARASPSATRRAVERGKGRTGPVLHWHFVRSQDLGRAWNGGPVDLVFIDGDHSFEGCREDFELWREHVGTGGAIALHDARATQPGGVGLAGPTAVVDQLLRAEGAGWEITAEADSLVVAARARRGERGRPLEAPQL
jgi:predicted O-methyltransferase YrrM